MNQPTRRDVLKAAALPLLGIPLQTGGRELSLAEHVALRVDTKVSAIGFPLTTSEREKLIKEAVGLIENKYRWIEAGCPPGNCFVEAEPLTRQEIETRKGQVTQYILDKLDEFLDEEKAEKLAAQERIASGFFA